MKTNIRTIEAKILENKPLLPSEEEYLVKTTDEFWENHPDVTRNFPRWKKYLAWIAGYQDYDYNRKLGKTMRVPSSGTRRLIFNRLRTFVRTLLAKLSAESHIPGVVPHSEESRDLQASEIGDKVALGLHYKMKFKQIENAIKLWLISINRAYLRVFWNEEDYGITGYVQNPQVDENGDEVLDENGNQVLSENWEPGIDEGDACMEAVSPFMCRHDPISINRKKWKWFIYGESVDAEALEEEYGFKEGELKEIEESNKLDTFGIDADETGFTAVTSKETRETVTGRLTLKKEFWTPKIFVLLAGGKFLKAKANVYKQIPFYRFEERLIPIDETELSINYNEPPLKDAISVQREYNRFKTIMSTNLERASKIKIMLPLNSVISRKAFTNEFGTFLDVNTAQGKPEQMKLDPLPSFTEVYINDLERELENIFTVRDASLGRLPERASHASGTLLSLLLEQDDVVLNPMLSMINDNLSEAWSLTLKMVADNYTVTRLLKYMGTSGKEAVVSFRGADLLGNTDVKITSQTGLPKSRALRTEFIMALKGAKMIDKRMALELMEFGNVEKVFSDVLVHERRAYRENMQIEKNPNIDPQEVVEWIYYLDDDLVHLPIHLRDRLGIKFEEQYNDNQRNALDAHIMMTYQKMIEKQMSMLQLSAPPEEGGAETGLPTETTSEEVQPPEPTA